MESGILCTDRTTKKEIETGDWNFLAMKLKLGTGIYFFSEINEELSQNNARKFPFRNSTVEPLFIVKAVFTLEEDNILDLTMDKDMAAYTLLKERLYEKIGYRSSDEDADNFTSSFILESSSNIRAIKGMLTGSNFSIIDRLKDYRVKCICVENESYIIQTTIFKESELYDR